MGVTKKYFHFVMAYHLAYTEDCKAKNILKFYSRSLHQREAMPLDLTTPVLLATWDLWGAWPSINFSTTLGVKYCYFIVIHLHFGCVVYLSVWWCMCAMVCLCVDQKTTYVGVSSLFYHVGSREQTQVARTGCKCLCRLSHLTSSNTYF